MTQALSLGDVERLLADGSPGSRSMVATAVARMGDVPALSASQREAWVDVVRVFARDAEMVVRAALAEEVKSSTSLPRDVAETLARDAIDVARPILGFSEALSEELLVELAAAGGPERQEAIAGRRSVSPPVSGALIANAEAPAVARLAANEGAQIEVGDFERMLERFAESWQVVQGVARRRQLPPSIAEKVIGLVARKLNVDLIKRHALPPAIAEKLIEHARDKTTAGYAAIIGRAESSRALARQMNQTGKLTPTAAIRSLCMGDQAFFEAALAMRSGLAADVVQAAISDPAGTGLSSACQKAGILANQLPVVRAALKAIADTPFEGDPSAHMQRVISRVLTQVEDIGSETLDFLLAKLGTLQTENRA